MYSILKDFFSINPPELFSLDTIYYDWGYDSIFFFDFKFRTITDNIH